MNSSKSVDQTNSVSYSFEFIAAELSQACSLQQLDRAQTALERLGKITRSAAEHKAYHDAANAVQRLICDLYV